MEIKRIIGPAISIALAIGIGVAVMVSHDRKVSDEAAKNTEAAIVDLKGMVGSEKESFFADPAVIERLRLKGFRVKTEKVGSREIATRDLRGYDFGFPAGAPAAIALQNKVKAKQVYPTFFTPMAIASWRILLPTLEQEGIVKKMNDAYYIINMKRLLEMTEKGVRWQDLAGNTAYPTRKSVLISSTDVRKSNSAAMYLALASYVFNDNNVVDNKEQVTRTLPFLSSLFLRQGLQESSSAAV